MRRWGELGTSAWVDRYVALIRGFWLITVQYRVILVVGLVSELIAPLIALGIWWSIAESGDIAGYGRQDFARYFFAVALVDQLTQAWQAWTLERRIRSGEMSFRLARPLAPVHEAVADNLVYKMRTVPVVLLAWMLAAAVWPAVRLPLEPVRWGLAIIAVVLGAAISFLSSYAIGLLAFWTTRVIALANLQAGVSLFLSGRIVPLALLPPTVGAVAGFLWFAYVLAFPVNVLTGVITNTHDYLLGLGAQLVWLAVWWKAYRFIWSRGLRRYGAVGG